MTPTTLRDLLDAIPLSQRGLADLMQRDESLVRKWARGAYPIPDDAAAWIALVLPKVAAMRQREVALLEKYPPPARTLK
jgi:hypothetical protein